MALGSRRTWVPIVLLAAIVAGCSGPPSLADVPLARDGVPELHARYFDQANQADIQLTVDGPVQIIDAAGEARSVYRVKPVPTPPYPTDSTYYLDRELRVVRIDSICSKPDGMGCESALKRDYRPEGQLPPFAFGRLPQIRADGGLVEWSNRTAVEVPHHLSKTGSTFLLDVSSPANPSSSSRWEFADSRWLPSLANGLRRTELQEGSLLRLADAIVPRELPSRGPWTPALMPDPATVPFPGGFSVQEFFDAAQNESHVHDAVADGGCIMNIDLFAPRDSQPSLPAPLPPVPLPGPAASTQQEASLILSHPGHASLIVRLALQRDAQGRVNATVSPEEIKGAHYPCDSLRRAPGPRVTFRGALEEAARLNLSVSSLVVAAAAAFPPDPTAAGSIQPENGWLQYQFHWGRANAAPNEVLGTYSAQLDAWTNRWVTIVSHPDDLRP